MKSVGYMAVGFCVFAVVVPEFMQDVTDRSDRAAIVSQDRDGNRQNQRRGDGTRKKIQRQIREDAHNPDAPDARPQARLQSGGGTAVTSRNRHGHFKFESRMNGVRINVLVDTGASSVAINSSTARKIGIRLNREDFRHTANTANGQTKYAAATIGEIRIGSVRVRNVSAAVLDDDSLSEVLLGMSFLNKLRKFEMQGDQLKLYQ